MKTYEKELMKAGLFDDDSDYEGMLGKAVKELMELFHNQGHSGASATMTATIFKTLADGKVLSPLTSNDNEWMEIGENMWQNTRCSAVFSDDIEHKKVYWIDGIIFESKDGSRYTSNESRVYFELPSMLPKQIIKKVDD